MKNCIPKEYISNKDNKRSIKLIFSFVRSGIDDDNVTESDLRDAFISRLTSDEYNIIGNEALVKDLEEIVNEYISRQNPEGKKQKLANEKVQLLNKFVKRIKDRFQNEVKTSTPVTTTEPVPEQTTNKENSEEVKNEEKIKDFLKEIYGNAQSAMSYRDKLFSDDINKICIVDIDNGTLTMNNDELNEYIREYKEQQFKLIVEYLKSIGESVPQENMFSVDSDENYTLNPDYVATLNKMYKVIKENKSNTEFKLKQGWGRQINGENDLFYLATNAYVNIFYFDRLLKHSFGKVVDIAKDAANDEVDPSYEKYSFSKKAAELAKGWETQENRDALQDTAKFSKRIIESIPMQSHQKKTKYPFNLTMVSFSNAITNLFSSIMSINNSNKSTSTQSKILDLLFKFHAQPRTYMSQVLNELFKIKSQKTLDEYKLNKFDLDVLYSIYDYMNKVGQIESKYISRHFTAGMSQYPITECILGVIDRVMQMSYLQSTIDDGKTVISVKSKFPRRQREYNLRNQINFSLSDRSTDQRSQLQKKYDVQKKLGEWSFKIKDIRYDIKSNKNIFTSSEINVGKIPDVDIFKNRDALLDPTAQLSPELQQFKDILTFIEENLSPYKILTETGLDKIIAAKQINDKILDQLFGAAAKNAIINKMYLEFESQNDEKDFYNFVSKKYPELLMNNLENQFYSVFTQGVGQKQLLGIRISDEWIDDIVTAEMVVNGDVSKANTKDIFGNSMGNYSTSFLGGNIFYYLYQSKYMFNGKEWVERPNSPQSNLLFARQTNFIRNIVVNTDAVSYSGQKKNVRNMKPGELYYQAIFQNFWGTSINKNDKRGRIAQAYVIQPTTYSDKTKIIQYVIDPNKEISKGQFPKYIQDKGRTYFGKTLQELNYKELEDLYYDTIGEYYKQIFENTIDKYHSIFGDKVTDQDSLIYTFNNINSLSKEQLSKLAKEQGFTLAKEGDFREDYLIKLAQSKGVQLMLDSDYRIIGGKLYFNELLDEYVNELYDNEFNLHERLEREKKNFIKDIKDSNTIFYLKYLDGKTSTIIEDIINEVFINKKYDPKEDYKYKVLYEKLGLKKGDNIRAKYLAKWTNNSKLIIDINGELNPLLEYYFMMDSLLSNNIRFSLTGTELSHNIKQKKPLSEEKGTEEYTRAILKIESLAQSAQLKRNVIIPGTLQYMQQDTLRGVTNRLRMAVIRDLKIPVFNFRGKVDRIDSSDGAAYVTPFTSILENNSLQDQKVGDVKKSIMHSMDHKTGGAVLGKWATFALTNELMNQALKSDVDLYGLFKRLTNHQWIIDGHYNSEFIDATKMQGQVLDLTQVRGVIKTRKLDFANDILKDKELYYIDETIDGRSVVKSIVNFGRDEHGYYTEEMQYSTNLHETLKKTKQKVYHLFDENSNHIRATEDELELYKGRNLHTINSLYELHAALGGLNSVEIDEDGKAVPSESSNYAVVEFMNIVAIEQSDNKGDITQHNYYQPLKFAQIDYAANNTSIKTGAANINQSSAWLDPDEKLQYMDINYDGIGIQMDADHEADEAELTEFSQVISSLDAGGKVHDIAKSVYNNLASVARQTSITEFEALHAFIRLLKERGVKKEAVSQLYDIVARTIINNLDVKNKANLSDEIMSKIEKNINNNVSHILDEYKVPFSDPGVYSTLLPTFVSNINKKSVKRKYAGSGYVMHPSYGFIQVFDIDGIPYQFMDIYEQQKGNYKRLQGESLANYKKRVVKNFLDAKQAEEKSKDRSEFIPTQNVLVKINHGDKTYTINISLLDPKYYVIFKQNYWKFLIEDKESEEGVKLTKEILDNSTFSFYNNVTKGRDLAPARITWTESDGKIHNIFDEKAIRDSFTDTLIYKDKDGLEKTIIVPKDTIDPKDIDSAKKFITGVLRDSFTEGSIQVIENEVNRAEIQKVFRQIKQGKIGDRVLFDIQNKAAEVILSSMHRSKFPEHTSLPNTLQNFSDFSFSSIGDIKGLESYEMALVKQNKKHSFITFKKVTSDLDNISSPQEKKFSYTKPVLVDGKVVIYAMSKDSQLLFPIGAGEVLEGYTYVNSEQAINTKSMLEDGEFIRGEHGEVIRIERFVKKYTVKYENKTKSGKKSIRTHYIYELNKELIDKYKQDASFILSKIYNEEGAMELRVNTDTTYDKNVLAGIVGGMQFDSSYMQKHKTNIHKVLKGEIKKKDYKSTIDSYYSNLNQALRTSFLMQLEITSSRIPAQTLQSFMQMQTIGYTNTRSNVCFVTPWQLFLQGSDYDIDKAYIMGCEIDDNGLYVGWSPLFEYFTLKTLKASQRLPFPTGKTLDWSRKRTTTIRTKKDGEVTEKTIDKLDVTEDVRRILDLYNQLDLLNQNYKKLEKKTTADKLLKRQNQERLYIQIINEQIQFLDKINKTAKGKDFKVFVDESISDEDVEKVIGAINTHQLYKPSEETLEASTKNSVSSKINLIVQDLENMDHAYSPIEMSHIRPDNSNLKVMSLMNPASKFIMQVENMVGKGVIGIAAVGEKIFFNLTYYWNERLRNAESREDLRNVTFVKYFNRIQDRRLGKPVANKVDRLANVNFDFQNVEQFIDTFNELYDIYYKVVDNNPGLDQKSSEFLEKFREEIRYYRDGLSQADLYISELLSAATDNAKELILAQINSGTDMAQNYLYLLTLGFEIKDIVAFMTSPAVKAVQSLSEFNMFNDHLRSLKIYDIVELMTGNLSKLYFTKKQVDNLAIKIRNRKVQNLKKLLSPELNEGKKLYEYLSTENEELQSIPEEKLTNKEKALILNVKNQIKDVQEASKGKNYIGQLISKLDADLIYIVNSEHKDPKYDFLQLMLNKISQAITPEYTIDEYFLDLEEFKRVNKSAQEATSLGNTLLGLNKGLPSSQVDLLEKLRNIAKIVEDREKEFGITNKFRSIVISELNKKQKDIEAEYPKLQEADESLTFFQKLQTLDHSSFVKILLNFSKTFGAMSTKLQNKNGIPEEEGNVSGFKGGTENESDYISSVLAFSLKDIEMSDGTKTYVLSNMDPREWLTNKKYRNFIKTYYNILKDTWNPFDVIESSPHYQELVNLLELIYIANNALSAKSNIINRIHKKLLRQHRFLDEQKLKGMMEYIDNRLVISWLENEIGQDFKFPVMEGESYIDINGRITQQPTLQLLDLTTAEGRASFKYVMENYIIPKLQSGELKQVEVTNGVSKVTDKTINVKDNLFIQGLVRAQNKSGVPFFKLDMDMTNVDGTPALQQQFQDYLDGLLELKNITYAGHTLSDLFIMYNLLVNKNTYGQDKMTSVFRSFIQVIEEDTLLKSYYKYIGDLDYNFDENTLESTLGIDYGDLELYMAKIINPSQESQVLDNYVLEYIGGFPVYKKRVLIDGAYKYIPVEIYSPRRINFSIDENMSNEARAIKVRYFLMPSPHHENKVYYNRKFDSGDVNQIFEVLQILQSQRIISLGIENCK